MKKNHILSVHTMYYIIYIDKSFNLLCMPIVFYLLHIHAWGNSLNILLVKYNNDFLDILSSGQGRCEVWNLYVGDTYVLPLGFKDANFQQKIKSDTTCGKTLTLYSSKVSTALVRCDLLLKIGILSPKGCLNFFPVCI